jgi:hypothetical protein
LSQSKHGGPGRQPVWRRTEWDRPARGGSDGLKGVYDFNLDSAAQPEFGCGRLGGRMGGDAAQPVGTYVDTPGASIFTAIQGLGLKLEARKALTLWWWTMWKGPRQKTRQESAPRIALTGSQAEEAPRLAVNAQKSTGAGTDQGKARKRLHACRPGLTGLLTAGELARFPILRAEPNAAVSEEKFPIERFAANADTFGRLRASQRYRKLVRKNILELPTVGGAITSYHHRGFVTELCHWFLPYAAIFRRSQLFYPRSPCGVWTD